MSGPRVSVVTATYNRSRVLRHTVASVIGQRFTDWELIVVGDACTDDTGDVVASFADERIRYRPLDVNVGEQSGPNNVGVSMCRGELIAFLNHDDLWFPDHLDVLVTAIEQTAADLAFSLAAALIPDRPPILCGFTPSGRYEPRTFVPASAWLLRRSLSERAGGWRSCRECYYDTRSESPCHGRIMELLVSEHRPQLVVVPPGIWHGVENVGSEPATIVNMPDQAYEYEQPDHWRLPPDTTEIPYTFSGC